MLKKISFLILFFTLAGVYAQNTNTKVVKPKTVAANTAVNAVPSQTPKKKVVKATSVPKDEVDYNEPPPVDMPDKKPANSTIRGRVYYEDTGRPVKRSTILLMPKDMKGGGSEISALTDGNGNFLMKNVREGSYFAMVNAPGVVSPLAYADMTKPRDEESFADAFAQFEVITVNGINDIDVQVAAKRGGAISGRVMYADGDAAIGVSVQILRKVGKNFIPVIPNFSAFAMAMSQTGGVFKTDDRGVYRMSGLPTGDYIVKVTEDVAHSENSGNRFDFFESSLFGRRSSLLTMFYPDVFETEKAQVINLQLGQEASEINVVIPNRELHNIEGKVIAGKDKLPIKNARIILKRVGDTTSNLFGDEGRNNISASTNDEGKFSFKEIPAGNYKATIEAQNSFFDEKKQIYGSNSSYNNYGANAASNAANYSYNSVPAKKYPKFSKKIQEIVIEDKDIENLNIELGFGATISGTAYVENSQEMPLYVSVVAYNEEIETSTSGGIGNYYKENGIDHDFEIEGVSEGKVSLIFHTEDYWVKSATFRGTDLLANPITVKEGESLKGVQVILSKEVGTLKGKVFTEDNQPAKRQGIVIFPTDAGKNRNLSYSKYAVTNENGEFEIKLPPLEYAVIPTPKDNSNFKTKEEVEKWRDEQIKTAQKVTVEVNKIETITIKLKK
jgi:hypothetical protein